MSEITIKVKPNGDVSVKTAHEGWTSRSTANAMNAVAQAFVRVLPAAVINGQYGIGEPDEPLVAALLVFLRATEDREDNAAQALREINDGARGALKGSLRTAQRVQAVRALRESAAMKAFVADTFNRLHELKEAALAQREYDPAVINLKKNST